MAYDKIVDSNQLNSDLTSVANAIRTKGGTSAQLAFPSGFVTAIESIPTSQVTTKRVGYVPNGVTVYDAELENILSLVRYGKCELDGTPSPSAPVNIVCNNGILKAVDNDLPSGYTRLTYLENTGTGYVDTGIVMNTIDLDVEVDFQSAGTLSGAPKMAWGFMGNASSLPRWGVGTYNSAWLGSPNVTTARGTADNDRHTIVMSVFESGGEPNYNGRIDGAVLYATSALSRDTMFIENDLSSYLFARNNNGTAGNNFTGKIYGFRVTKADTLIHDLVPCKNASDDLGFYDLVANTFIGAIGTLVAGAVDYSHSHIEADGTPEALTVGAQTASVADLFHVGSYADEQDVISGAVTRKVGVRVLTGEETMSYTSGMLLVTISDIISSGRGLNRLLCSHYRERTSGDYYVNHNYANAYVYMHNVDLTSLEEWKSWLAAQCANGTPVIVIYPLAEPTTEQTEPQPLTLAEGTNTLTAVAAVKDIKFDFEYNG